MKEILLFSGGLDSLVAYHYLGKPPCLYINEHSRYSYKEERVVLNLAYKYNIPLTIIDNQDWLRQFEEEDANIPGRNGLFCWIAASYADTIYLVCQLGEQSIPDRNPDNLDKLASVMSTFFGIKKTIDTVFSVITKQDMVKWALDIGIPKETLWEAYSCFSKEANRCGQCKACARTALALDYNNILPDTMFNRDIWKWSGWQDYIKHLSDYETRRRQQYKKVFEKRNLI